MRAKHKSGFVYTTRGHDPEMERLRDSAALTVAPSTPRVATLADRRVCPHDGDYVDGYPRCGFCLGNPRNATTAEESFAAFLLSLHDVAKKAAWSIIYTGRNESKRLTYEDGVSECFMLLLNPKNLKTIAAARRPLAMATTIAQRRLKNVYRDPYYQQTIPVGWTTARDPETAELLNNTDKLDYFTHLDREVSGDYIQQPDNIRLFPGFALLWTPENIRRLLNLMNEALDKLPKYPYSHSMLIKLRHGTFGDEEYTWSELAKSATDSSGKNITTDQVRYAVATGEDEIRAHILKSLEPVSSVK
jgi:hypothetical protein